MRCSRALALLLLALPASVGCFSGHLLEASRIHEQVLAYDQAHRSDDRLLLDYRVRLQDRKGALLGVERRAVALRIEDLQRDPELSVDVFPVEALEAGDALREGAQPIAVVTDAKPPSGHAPELRVSVEENRHTGFALVGAGLGAARFHSGALRRSRYAWWGWALVPFVAPVDLVLPVVLVPTALPFFVLDE